jgi:hypothetical protein
VRERKNLKKSERWASIISVAKLAQLKITRYLRKCIVSASIYIFICPDWL